MRPVGESKPRNIDVRVLAATSRDLEADVGTGRFRDDLYYRLNVIRLNVPPLRERPKPIKFRPGDFWHDFADEFNELAQTVQSLREGGQDVVVSAIDETAEPVAAAT